MNNIKSAWLSHLSKSGSGIDVKLELSEDVQAHIDISTDM